MTLWLRKNDKVLEIEVSKENSKIIDEDGKLDQVIEYIHMGEGSKFDTQNSMIRLRTNITDSENQTTKPANPVNDRIGPSPMNHFFKKIKMKIMAKNISQVMI